MEPPTIFDRVQTCIITALLLTEKERAAVTPLTSLAEDLGTDSLDLIELNLALDEEFDLELDQKAVATCRTVGDVAALVARHATPSSD